MSSRGTTDKQKFNITNARKSEDDMDKFYRGFFIVVVGALAMYGALNLATRIRLGENISPTLPKIVHDDTAPDNLPPPMGIGKK